MAVIVSEVNGGIQGLKNFKGIQPFAKIVELDGVIYAGENVAMARTEFIQAILQFSADHPQN
jgi:hypothetical protein